MEFEPYHRGKIGANRSSDEINLNVIRNKLGFFNQHPEFGYTVNTSSDRLKIPHFVVNKQSLDWKRDSRPTEEKLIELVNEQAASIQRDLILDAIKHPAGFAFRAFQRTYAEKAKYRLIGLDCDKDVIDYNLETEGAEYSALWTQEAYFNLSLGDLIALRHFGPSLYYENGKPVAIWSWNASSYLQIYKRHGIEETGSFWSIKITDDEPLYNKRLALLRIDWQLPGDIKLPGSYGL